MPTIEIICVEQAVPLDFADLPFAVEVENVVRSHRGLFMEVIESLRGCIYHLGNPNLAVDGEGRRFLFFAYDLLDRTREGEFLEFDVKYAPFVREMFLILHEASPVRKLVFLSDWQFGPENVTMGGQVTFEDFWTMHDNHQLRLNGLYEIF